MRSNCYLWQVEQFRNILEQILKLFSYKHYWQTVDGRLLNKKCYSMVRHSTRYIYWFTICKWIRLMLIIHLQTDRYFCWEKSVFKWKKDTRESTTMLTEWYIFDFHYIIQLWQQHILKWNRIANGKSIRSPKEITM